MNIKSTFIDHKLRNGLYDGEEQDEEHGETDGGKDDISDDKPSFLVEGDGLRRRCRHIPDSFRLVFTIIAGNRRSSKASVRILLRKARASKSCRISWMNTRASDITKDERMKG